MKTLLLVLGLLAAIRVAGQSKLTLEQTPAGRLKADLSAPGAKRIGLQFRWDMAEATPWLNWGTSTSGTNDSLEMAPPGAATRFFRVNAEAPENNGGSVFDPSRVAVIRLTVATSNYVILTNIVGGDSSIANNDGEYVPADFEFDGLQLANVAVRRKGNSSGLRVDPSRPNYIPLKVDFNRYVDGQKLKGLKKVNLHVASSSSGGSGLEDYLGYGAFQEFGVPAPRTGWADVWLNGEYVGLYTTVEQVDDGFLARCFGSPAGNLYKPESPAGTLEWRGTNYLSYTNANFDRGDDEAHGAFIGFVRAINQRPASEFASVMDLSGIQACIAGWFALGAWDNYLAMAHNFYLYEAKPGVMTMFPWDMNDSMGNSTNLFASSLGGGGIGGGLTNGLPGGMTNFPGGLTNGLPAGMTNFPGGMTNGLPGGMTNFPGGSGPLTSTNRPLTDKLFAYPPTRRRHLELVAEFLAGSGSRPRLESRIDVVQAVLTNRLSSTSVLALKSNITARTTGLDAQLRAEGIIP